MSNYIPITHFFNLMLRLQLTIHISQSKLFLSFHDAAFFATLTSDLVNPCNRSTENFDSCKASMTQHDNVSNHLKLFLHFSRMFNELAAFNLHTIVKMTNKRKKKFRVGLFMRASRFDRNLGAAAS